VLLIVVATALVTLAVAGRSGARADSDHAGAAIAATAHPADQAAVVARRAPEALRAVHLRLSRSTALAAVAALILSLAITSPPGRRRRVVGAISPAVVLRRHSITLRAPPVLQLTSA
jgi:hypothetical protein